jgi:hypothetical protein
MVSLGVLVRAHYSPIVPDCANPQSLSSDLHRGAGEISTGTVDKAGDMHRPAHGIARRGAICAAVLNA